MNGKKYVNIIDGSLFRLFRDVNKALLGLLHLFEDVIKRSSVYYIYLKTKINFYYLNLINKNYLDLFFYDI